jgi:hypothetical protein
VACALPAFDLRHNDQAHAIEAASGAWCALWGPLGFVSECVAWYANVTAFVGTLLFAFRRDRLCLVLAGVSVLLALTTLRLFTHDIPMDEAGVNTARVSQLRPAFFVWLASLLVPAVASVGFTLRRAAGS